MDATDDDEAIKTRTESAIRVGVDDSDSEVALRHLAIRPVSRTASARELPGALTESVRSVRSELMFAWLNKGTRHILAVTSPGRQEGRSWLASNLALGLSMTGRRVLLVDADMRRPQQHVLFNLENSAGLSALLGGRMSGPAVVDLQLAPRLSVLTAGPPTSNAEELLSGVKFSMLLDRLTNFYDIIVLDTPAATESCEAQLIAGRAGSALMIARRNQTRHANLSAALKQMQAASVNVVGCVLNDH